MCPERCFIVLVKKFNVLINMFNVRKFYYICSENNQSIMNNKTPAEICEAIALDLKARKITHQQLADMLGKSKGVVSTQISGKKKFSTDMAALYSRALGYNIRFLLYGEGELRDDAAVRDIVLVPGKGEDTDFSPAVMVSLLQIAGDIIGMTGCGDAVAAWNAINNGDFKGYQQNVAALKEKSGSGIAGSPILAHFVCEQINGKIGIIVRAEE